LAALAGQSPYGDNGIFLSGSYPAGQTVPASKTVTEIGLNSANTSGGERITTLTITQSCSSLESYVGSGTQGFSNNAVGCGTNNNSDTFSLTYPTSLSRASVNQFSFGVWLDDGAYDLMHFASTYCPGKPAGCGQYTTNDEVHYTLEVSDGAHTATVTLISDNWTPNDPTATPGNANFNVGTMSFTVCGGNGRSCVGLTGPHLDTSALGATIKTIKLTLTAGVYGMDIGLNQFKAL
jgi:hypothetical protein